MYGCVSVFRFQFTVCFPLKMCLILLLFYNQTKSTFFLSSERAEERERERARGRNKIKLPIYVNLLFSHLSTSGFSLSFFSAAAFVAATAVVVVVIVSIELDSSRQMCVNS